MLAVIAGAGGVLGGAGHEPGGGGANERSRTAIVTRVVDGDTVVLSGVGRSRLIGVDTPEVFGAAECHGAQASEFAKRLLTGRRATATGARSST